ncbi:MAG: sialate O-acetylesterase [Kiritimatiellia bacterium]
MKRSLWFVSCAFALAGAAEVKLAPVFGDRMVLQREKPVRVWGTAASNEAVTVTFGAQTVTTRACGKGLWKVELAPMPASKEGRTLKAGNAEIKDVLVGEVWFCSGQSNTDCPIWGGSPRYRDGQGALTLQMTMKPFVRLVKTPFAWAPTPKSDVTANWMEMTPELYAAFKRGVRMPSAMGYYFALELATALDVPIGLVDSSCGGTNIDSWTPRSGLATRPDLKDVLDWPMADHKSWNDTMKKGPVSGPHQQPSALWNGMVAAYAPMAIRGFIWYQGCHNAGEWQRYASKMHALHDGWANEFQNPDLKLYFAQLAPWGNSGIAYIQQAQAQFDREEPRAGMAVINDVGNLKDIHPNDKRTVAKRLAAHALKRDYGWTALNDNSPTLKSWKIEGGKFVLSFNDAEGWYVYNPDRSVQTGFEVAGDDGKFVPAQIENLVWGKDRNGNARCDGVVKGADLIVGAKGVDAPKKLRYLYSAPWFGCLYNESSLPLGAFHIGD